MKRNRKLAVVICICLILSLCLPFFLSGCRKKKIDSEMSVYYLNEDRTGLVKAPYETGKTAKGKKMTDKEICGMAEDILETLLPSLQNLRLFPEKCITLYQHIIKIKFFQFFYRLQ